MSEEPRQFRPEVILRTLQNFHVQYVLIGGLAAILHGSPFMTLDVDVCPSRVRENLSRLAEALTEMDARIRAEGVPAGLPFDRSAQFLSRVELCNLTTKFGDLDIAFQPAGTTGYQDLARDAETYEIRGVQAQVASLAGVVRSKSAANRDKDRAVLPTLRELLDRTKSREQE